ncbi:zeta toxin family protein [Priestia aryabhattai]
MNYYKSTKEKHTENGEYTEERREKHTKIIEYFLNNNPNLKSPPEAVLLGGGSGVGKSTLRDFLLDDYKRRDIPIVIVDSDAIKALIPEYEERIKVDDKSAAKYVHDESSDISSKLISRCIAERKNFIYDGTMKNLEKYSSIIENLKSNGYNVVVMIVDTSIAIAKDRVYARFLKTGRNVPYRDIVESHIGVAKVFPIIKDMVDEYMLVDTSESDETSEDFPFNYVVTRMEGEEEVIHDAEKLERFYQKGSISPFRRVIE